MHVCAYIYTYTHQKHEDHSAWKHPAAKELSFALVKKDLWIINILCGHWSKLMVNPTAAFVSNNLLYYQPNVCLFSYYGNENCEIMCWPQFWKDPYLFALASGLLPFSKALSFVITYLNKVCLLTKEGYIGEEYIRFNSIWTATCIAHHVNWVSWYTLYVASFAPSTWEICLRYIICTIHKSCIYLWKWQSSIIYIMAVDAMIGIYIIVDSHSPKIIAYPHMIIK